MPPCGLSTSRLEQNDWNYAEDIFKLILFCELFYILIKISPKFAPNDAINNKPVLVQIMAWHQIGDKPLSGPMMI